MGMFSERKEGKQMRGAWREKSNRHLIWMSIVMIGFVGIWFLRLLLLKFIWQLF